VLVDFDDQLIFTRRQIVKAVSAAVSDLPSFAFGSGGSCEFLTGRTEEDQGCLQRSSALASSFDSDCHFAK
jgi:hypothetical protein